MPNHVSPTALGLAAAGVLLVAAPLEDLAPVAVAAEAPELRVPVSGVAARGPCPSEGESDESGIVRTTRDGYCNPSWSMTDPRLNGVVTWASNEDQYLDDTGLLVRTVAVSVEDDEGAWRMVPEIQFGSPEDGPDGLPSQFVLVGEGGYAGLHAVLGYEPETSTLAGYILEGELPPAPEPVAAG